MWEESEIIQKEVVDRTREEAEKIVVELKRKDQEDRDQEDLEQDQCQINMVDSLSLSSIMTT